MILTILHPSSLILHPLFISWNPSEVICHLGPIAVRWYGMCWLVGIVLGYFTVKWLYRDQKVKDELFDPLFIYCFLGILIGARLGHCLFYEPEVWLSSWQRVVEIFIPIQIEPGGGWHFTGYAGLASHGGTLGLIIALWLYYRRTKMNLWHVLDDIAIATGITACFIRLGNLMNSEIIGKPTDVPWAFIFEQVDPLPRHPGQLYEAIAYLLLYFLMLWIYIKKDKRRKALAEGMKDKSGNITPPASGISVGTGFYFGLCLTYIFAFRFFIEYTKEIQVAKEAGFALNIGQLLSIPFVIIGVACMIRAWKVKS